MGRNADAGFLPTQHEISAVALVVGSNLALNGALHRRYFVPAALFSAAGMLFIARLAGATTEQQGLTVESAPRGLKIGLVIGVPVFATMAAAAYVPFTREFFRDERIIRADASAVLYELFLRMPLATAMGEELTFRSALEGILRRRRSATQALLASAAIFGIWHALPTLDRLHSNPGAKGVHKNSRLTQLAIVTGVCCATAAASVVLSWVKEKTGSVVTPIVVHCAVNSGAFAGGWLASRGKDGVSTTRAQPRPVAVVASNYVEN
jgi:uncharacterized protein